MNFNFVQTEPNQALRCEFVWVVVRNLLSQVDWRISERNEHIIVRLVQFVYMVDRSPS